MWKMLEVYDNLSSLNCVLFCGSLLMLPSSVSSLLLSLPSELHRTSTVREKTVMYPVHNQSSLYDLYYKILFCEHCDEVHKPYLACHTNVHFLICSILNTISALE